MSKEKAKWIYFRGIKDLNSVNVQNAIVHTVVWTHHIALIVEEKWVDLRRLKKYND